MRVNHSPCPMDKMEQKGFISVLMQIFAVVRYGSLHIDFHHRPGVIAVNLGLDV